MIKIAFAGCTGSGKTTAAAFFAELSRNKNMIRSEHSFLSAIRSQCQNLFGLSWHDVNTPEGKERVVAPYNRTVNQLILAQEQFLRSLNEDYCVTKTMSDVDTVSLMGDVDALLIKDVRHSNELNACLERGFTTIKIKRNVYGVNSFITEQELPDDKFTYIIDNNGTIPEFKEKLKQIKEFKMLL